MWLFWILSIAAAYLIGSIPFGYIISQLSDGVDITKRGSGNIGATNVSKEIGIKYGVITLMLDALKGFIPVHITCYLFGENEILIVMAGVSAIIGHMFSIYLKFRGGKGVATAIGVYLAWNPLPLLIGMIIFFITVYLWNFISLGSMISMLAMPFLLIAFGQTDTFIIGSGIIALLIVMKHYENILRLKRGEERRWREKGSLE